MDEVRSGILSSNLINKKDWLKLNQSWGKRKSDAGYAGRLPRLK